LNEGSSKKRRGKSAATRMVPVAAIQLTSQFQILV
jgi:hypothetical protein